jgi:hypothetical protein
MSADAATKRAEVLSQRERLERSRVALRHSLGASTRRTDVQPYEEVEGTIEPRVHGDRRSQFPRSKVMKALLSPQGRWLGMTALGLGSVLVRRVLPNHPIGRAVVLFSTIRRAMR